MEDILFKISCFLILKWAAKHATSSPCAQSAKKYIVYTRVYLFMGSKWENFVKMGHHKKICDVSLWHIFSIHLTGAVCDTMQFIRIIICVFVNFMLNICTVLYRERDYERLMQMSVLWNSTLYQPKWTLWTHLKMKGTNNPLKFNLRVNEKRI